jgi:hypothetical protein
MVRSTVIELWLPLWQIHPANPAVHLYLHALERMLGLQAEWYL